MPPATTKNSKAKKGLAAKTSLTHRDLGLVFRGIGFKTRKARPKVYRALADPAGHKSDTFRRMLARAAGGRFSSKAFNRSYRDALPSHDEILSTSSVREIVIGVLESHHQKALAPAEIDAVNTAINDVSRVRMRTAHVGYAFAGGDVMQHPTNIEDAVFANPRSTASAHARHDIARRAAAAEEAQAELKNPNADIVTVTRAALRGAILYSLDDMTAASTASDVEPFTRSKSKPKKLAQVRDRDQLKVALLEVGGSVKPDDPSETTAAQRLSRRSRTARGTRSASPFRMPELAPKPALGSI